ncbi:MAG TPA: hypothetical protein VJS64_17755 [Pyrinomonadaceae bacterium]|nr:hypothetical protein [Pyrinomonadaceae bacterium]
MIKEKALIAITTLIVGCSLCLVTFQALNTGVPKPWAPFPFPLVILLWLGTPGILVLSLGALAMWAWNPKAFAGKSQIPKRSLILLLILTCLSIFQNIISLPYGKKYQGEFHTIVVTAMNFSLIIALMIIGAWARRKPSFPLNLGFHWLMFAWVVSYAFPYLGELP